MALQIGRTCSISQGVNFDMLSWFLVGKMRLLLDAVAASLFLKTLFCFCARNCMLMCYIFVPHHAQNVFVLSDVNAPCEACGTGVI